MTNTSTRRKLRLSPRDVMTGDVLLDRAFQAAGNLTVECIVTSVDPIQRTGLPTLWRIETIDPQGDTSAARYAVQRRVTVFRTGPKGLGEK